MRPLQPVPAMRRFSKADATPARRFRQRWVESDRSLRTRASVFCPEGPTLQLARNCARRIARQINFVSK